MRCILFSTAGDPLPPFRLVLYLAVVSTILTPATAALYFVVLFYCYRYFLLAYYINHLNTPATSTHVQLMLL